MTTARETFEARALKRKYGVVGSVAARYRMAGYRVEVLEGGAADFVARRRGEGLAVKVYSSNAPIPVNVVEELASYASNNGLRPVIILYGAGPRLAEDALEKVRSLNVSVRRVRP
ncbi:MAG: hypothetical protein F7C08_02245 [Desulfurococcales archaeon]|nr:hypothetical protein [Desulfurococcales archaeon]MCE4605339.1 hypothetical protein [Desulfurococcales archaeon]